MAAQRNGRAGGSGTRQQRRGSNQRRASEKTEKYRFAQNVGGEGTVAEREYQAYAQGGFDKDGRDPDVLLDVPVVKVDLIHLELDDLNAHVALQAKVLDLVKLNAGIDVHLGRLRIDIEGVEAQALLKVRLDHVTAIVDRLLTTLDRNPKLVESLGRTVEHVGGGARHALEETGEGLEQVGQGAQGAVGQIGSGAGQAVGEIGEGAGQAVGDVGQGAGQAVGDVGEGAGEAVGDVGEGAGEAVGDVGEGAGEAVGDVGEGAGEAVGNLDQTVKGVGETVGEAGEGVGQAAGGLSQGAQSALGELGQAVSGAAQQGGGDDGGLLRERTKGVAKLAAKFVAEDVRANAAQEAKALARKALDATEPREKSRTRKSAKSR